MKKQILRKVWAILALVFVASLCELTDEDRNDIARLPPLPAELKTIFPGGWEEVWQKNGAHSLITQSIFLAAVDAYVDFEGKLPSSMKEICDGPYMPVDCKEIPNILIGKPLLETPRGTLGWFEYEPPVNPTDFSQPIYFLETVLKIAGNRVTVGEDRTPNHMLPNMRRGKIVTYPKTLGDAWKTALAVRIVLGAVVSMFPWCRQERLPRSFEELIELSPFLKKLRNGFSGEYARLTMFRVFHPTTEKEAWKIYREVKLNTTGPPGDFAIILLKIPELHFARQPILVFGADGRDIDIAMIPLLFPGETFEDFIPLPFRENNAFSP